jgi:hypothetical protein
MWFQVMAGSVNMQQELNFKYSLDERHTSELRHSSGICPKELGEKTQ